MCHSPGYPCTEDFCCGFSTRKTRMNRYVSLSPIIAVGAWRPPPVGPSIRRLLCMAFAQSPFSLAKPFGRKRLMTCCFNLTGGCADSRCLNKHMATGTAEKRQRPNAELSTRCPLAVVGMNETNISWITASLSVVNLSIYCYEEPSSRFRVNMKHSTSGTQH